MIDEIKKFKTFLNEGTSEEPEDDWEEIDPDLNVYDVFIDWLHQRGFDFYDGEQDFRGKYEDTIADDELEKEDKIFQLTRFLEDRWGLHDGWDDVVDKLTELL